MYSFMLGTAYQARKSHVQPVSFVLFAFIPLSLLKLWSFVKPEDVLLTLCYSNNSFTVALGY